MKGLLDLRLPDIFDTLVTGMPTARVLPLPHIKTPQEVVSRAATLQAFSSRCQAEGSVEAQMEQDRHSGTRLLKKCLFLGGKTCINLAKFFLGLYHTHNKIQFAKNRTKISHSSSQQWSEQSTDAYMGSQPPTR